MAEPDLRGGGDEMSIKNREVPFSFQGHHDHAEERREFTGIRELGFSRYGSFVIDAWTTPHVAPGEPRGGYMTSIPISPIEYRRKHGLGRVGFRREPGRLVIFNDYGGGYVIEAPPDVLDTLAAECIANEIPEKAPSTSGGDR